MKDFSVVTLKELRVQEQPCFGTGWWSFPREGGEGKGRILLLPASAFWLLQPGPQFGSSGLQSLLAVVVKVVHGEGGCVVGTGVLGDSQRLSRKIALGNKGLERRTMTAAKRSVWGRIHRLMTGF